MNIADRVQSLRKAKGISKEELADRIGVSRQAVSKWESEQSTPDIEKIILLSEFFDVTTDYLLKGIEQKQDKTEKKSDEADARIFAIAASAINFIGLVAAIMVWVEEKSSVSVAIGLIIMAIGCMIFLIGQFTGENKKHAGIIFAAGNVWFLTLIPASFIFNSIQGMLYGKWWWWTISPLPQMGRSVTAYVIFCLVYFGVCTIVDIVVILKYHKGIKG